MSLAGALAGLRLCLGGGVLVCDVSEHGAEINWRLGPSVHGE